MWSPRVMVAGETNVGMKRPHNEDNFAVLNDAHLYVVADGMGGHAKGEVASKLAIDTVSEFFTATEKDPEATWPYKMDKARGYEENRLITGVKLANLRIFQAWQSSPGATMGTTIVALHLVPEGVLIAHVGDSRAYRLRDGKLDQMTEDHSLLNDYIKMRKMSEQDIANFQYKNIILRALGMKDQVKVDTQLDVPKPGDLYILCSDGLSGPVTDDEIREIGGSSPDVRTVVEKLIERANQNGGPDNITVIACKWLGAG